MNKLKIAIINKHPLDTLGGSEIQCDIIARELTKFGHEVKYLAIDGEKNKYEVDYEVIKLSRDSQLVANRVIKENPDIIYWRHNKHNFYQTVKRIKDNNFKIIFAVSSIDDVLKWRKIRTRPQGRYYLKHYIYNIKRVLTARWNYKGFDYVDGVTSLNKDYLNYLDIDRKKYIPNSMNMDVANFDWKRPYIFWVANLKAQKRPEVCINVANAVKDLELDVIMVGKIQDQHYSYFNLKKNLPDNLHYLGTKTIQEVNGILKDSICLFHTCKPEGFGNNFIQAWLQGKPTVSLEFDPSGLIESEKMGFVSGDNMEQFQTDIIKLVEDKGLNLQMGENAKNYAMNNHHPETNVRKLISFMEEILSKK